MFLKKMAVIMGTTMVLSLAVVNTSRAACPEGVLHRLIRTVFQVPMAVLKSLEGPTCCSRSRDYSATVRYPDTRGVYGPEYRLNTQKNYEPLPEPPEYVTYKMIPARKTRLKPDSEVNLHVYSSIPFSDR